MIQRLEDMLTCRVPETAVLYDILRPYIEDDIDGLGEDSPFFVYRAEGVTKQILVVFEEPFFFKIFLVSILGFGGLDFKLKCEGLNDTAVRHKRRYHDLELSKTLVKNLEGQSLIEHPIVVITMKTHRHFFEDDSCDGEQDQPSSQSPGTFRYCLSCAYLIHIVLRPQYLYY